MILSSSYVKKPILIVVCINYISMFQVKQQQSEANLLTLSTNETRIGLFSNVRELTDFLE